MNLELLEVWLKRNGGVGELAHLSKVSPHTILKLKNRIRPKVPKKHVTQLLLAEAMGVGIDDLFPPSNEGEEQAS